MVTPSVFLNPEVVAQRYLNIAVFRYDSRKNLDRAANAFNSPDGGGILLQSRAAQKIKPRAGPGLCESKGACS